MVERRYIPPLSALKVFEAATRTGSFTRAAAECGLTQGAVSRQIRSLEEFLGIKLFAKDGRNVRMTAAAQNYHTSIRTALDTIASATRKAMAKDTSRVIQLGVLPTFSSHWLIPRLSSFIEEHPGISVSMTIKPHPFDFRSDNLDAAIHVGDENWPDAQCDLLFPEQAVIVGSPALVAKYPIGSPAELLDKPLISGGTKPTEWPLVFGWPEFFRRHALPDDTHQAMQLATYASVGNSAMASQGFAIIPTVFIRNELSNGQLVVAYGAPFLTGRSYYLVFPPETLRQSAFRKFRSWIVEASKNMRPPAGPTG